MRFLSLFLLALSVHAAYGPNELFTATLDSQSDTHKAEINVEIKDAKTLFLVIEASDNGQGGDFTAWIEPTLVGPDGELSLTDQKWKHAKSGHKNVERNKSASGNALFVGGKEVSGFGTHAPSLIEFDVPEGYTHFRSTAALDDAGISESKVVVSVHIDHKPELEDPGFPFRETTPLTDAKTFLNTVEMPDGYSLELVAGEPTILEPVHMVFDGNGVMYVAEMRTYMQDIDNSNKFEPISRVSRHEDTNGDGTYDRHTVFADNLILPRNLLTLDHRVVIGETNTNDLFVYEDTDGDGVSDKKEEFYIGGNRGGNLEHQPNGLVWALDNWLYTTYNSYRLRYRDGKVEKEGTGGNGAQWGIAQDDYGKMWMINGGGEKGPVNYEQHILYGQFGGGMEKDFRIPWPSVGLFDYQGGTRRTRPDGTLNHFTATTGADVYRGDRLPKELYGDVFFGEPVGRLVRRSKVVVEEGMTELRNPHAADKTEFLRSSDPCFRPVNMATAPDGTLYVIDMYRGIIQEGNWVRPGSYLRKVVRQYALDKNFGHGRIWRVRHKDHTPGPQPKMLDETPAQLVAHLSHPNGWWRDTAQKLIILKGDKSVVPALRTLASSSDNHLARIHATWTLEGLGDLTADDIRVGLKAEHPMVRHGAIRAAESVFKGGDTSIEADLHAMAEDEDASVLIQYMLTSRHLKLKEHTALNRALAADHALRGVREIGGKVAGGGGGGRKKPAAPQMTKEEQASHKRGKAIYDSLCTNCHGKDGKGTPMVGEGVPKGALLAPAFAGSPTLMGHHDLPISVVLHGLSGEIRGKKYMGQMIPMNTYDDKWVADVLSFARNSFGNSGAFIQATQVAKVRAATKDRKTPFTMKELEASIPQKLANRKAWKFKASHGDNFVGAVDGQANSRWDTKAAQVPGMWLRIELPTPTKLGGLLLDSRGSARDYPRGYKVTLSDDGETWTEAVATGAGTHPLTAIYLDMPTATYIKIEQTGKAPRLYWSIHELDILGIPVKVEPSDLLKDAGLE
jgi:glucose/arabinose dehydrogenase/mono/diheme cytochrome c family protein